MIIARGESIVAVGVGVSDIELGAGGVAAAALGVAIAAALWWAYFDVVAVAARKLHESRRGYAQNTMARDSYSYLHLPMVAGIVLLALGVKKALEHVDEPLSVVAAAALCGGVALYLLAHVAFRLRNVGTLNRQRLVTIAVLIRAHAARGERHRPLGAARGGPGVHRADRLRGDPLPGGAGTRTRAG